MSYTTVLVRAGASAAAADTAAAHAAHRTGLANAGSVRHRGRPVPLVH